MMHKKLYGNSFCYPLTSALTSALTIVLSLQAISITSCLTTTPPPNSNKKKHNLLIFGHGNVAQAVIKYATTSIDIDINQSSDTYVNGPYFDSIICTYHKTPPSTSNLEQQDTYGIPIHYLPFDDNDYGEESIIHFLKTNTATISQHISHVLMTIPPQPMFDRDSKSTSSSSSDSNSRSNKNDDENTAIIYRDVVLDSDIMNNIPKCEKMAFVSTTGVYGNHNGGWVDENSQTNCKVGSKAHDGYLKVENQWRDFARSSSKTNQSSGATSTTSSRRRTFIFRCSGLYGSDFSALHTVRKKGWKGSNERREDNNDRHEDITSRVHLDDVGRAILACLVQPEDAGNGKDQIAHSPYDGSDIYNLSDDMPSPRNEVMHFAYGLLKGAHIDIGVGTKSQYHNQQQQRQLENVEGIFSERRKRRTKDRKRVSNKKMKEILQPYGGLKYSSFREGLIDVLKMNEHW